MQKVIAKVAKPMILCPMFAITVEFLVELAVVLVNDHPVCINSSGKNTFKFAHNFAGDDKWNLNVIYV